MLDHNEKPFIHLKARAFVCPFLFEMIFTDLALRVINPFIIKTVLKSSDTSEPKFSFILKSYAAVTFPEISNFLKTVGGGRSACRAGLQQFVTFPGNLNIPVLRGPGLFPPMWRLPSHHRDFPQKRTFCWFYETGAGCWAQPGGRGRAVCKDRRLAGGEAGAGKCHIYFNSVDNNKI